MTCDWKDLSRVPATGHVYSPARRKTEEAASTAGVAAAPTRMAAANTQIWGSPGEIVSLLWNYWRRKVNFLWVKQAKQRTLLIFHLQFFYFPSTVPCLFQVNKQDKDAAWQHCLMLPAVSLLLLQYKGITLIPWLRYKEPDKNYVSMLITFICFFWRPKEILKCQFVLSSSRLCCWTPK